MTKRKLRGDKRFWSPVAISLGLATFFFGVISLPATPDQVRGWVCIIVGIVLFIIGFSAAPFRESQQISSEPEKVVGNTHASSGKTNKSSPSNEEYEVYRQERESLVNALQDQARSFDKYVLTLAAGTFGLSLLLVRQIAPQPIPDTLGLLIGAWFAFGTSILLTLLSFLFSQQACLKQIRIIEETLLREVPDHEGSLINPFTKLTQILNWFSMVSFIFGVILLAIFSFQNLMSSGGG